MKENEPAVPGASQPGGDHLLPDAHDAAPDDAHRGAAAEARAEILARRVATLEAVVAVERRMRDVQEMAARAAAGLPDITVPRAHGVEDDATIPVPHYRPADDDTTRPVPRPHGTQPVHHTIPANWQEAAEPHALNRTVGGHSATPLALPQGFNLFEYRLDAVLGQGGFGITYLAVDVNLDVKVAIKEYLPAGFATRESDRSVSPRWAEDNSVYLSGLECFLVEARTLATFRHPNIVRVSRFFEAHKTAYMVLEYERGQPLKQWWPEHRNLGEAQLLALLQPLMDGLQLVHESGYLHRDIKPDNIYVRKDDGSLVLLDFGAARQTIGGRQAMADVVTPGYAPPEQFTGGSQGPWTDIYALGATLYWMITGAKPPAAPERENGSAAMTPALEAGRGAYGEEFLQAIDAALALDPAARPQTIQDFSRLLCAAHAGALGLREALLLGEARAQKRLTDGVRRFGRALWRPARWPLAVKMTVAMVATALLPMLATNVLNLRGAMAVVGASEKRNLESIAQSTAGRVEQLVEDSRNLAAFVAGDPLFIDYLQQPTPVLERQIDAKLASLKKTHTHMRLMFVMNREGKALVASGPGVAGRNFAFRDYFRSAVQGRPYTTAITLSSTDNKPSMYHANPVLGPTGEVIGVVVLSINGTALGAVLDEPGLRGNRNVFMVDGDGVVIHHTDGQHLYDSVGPLTPAALARIQADKRFASHRVDNLGMPALAQTLGSARLPGNLSFHSTISGQDEHAGYAPVKGYGWTVAVTEPRQQFEAPLREMFHRVVEHAALIGCLFVLLAMLFARSITRPIIRLTVAANALKDGQYTNLKVTSDDELGRLARTFNVMVDVLRQRERERDRPRKNSDQDKTS